MIKLIACDLDNTLLNADHLLSNEDSNLIQKIQNMGIEFIVATGRSYEGARHIIECYGLHCNYILLNGALIMQGNGEILQEFPIPQDTLRVLLDLLQKEDMCFHMYGKEGTVSLDPERNRQELMGHLLRSGLTKDEAVELMTKGNFGVIDRAVDDVASYIAEEPVIYKVEMFAKDAKHQIQFREKLKSIEHIDVTNSVADNIEITDINAQKGIALHHYCKQQGIQKEEVVVFGDSLNDLNMISKFPHSFAVANAIAEIKEKANYITLSNLEGGVAHALKALLEHQGNEKFLRGFQNNTK